MQNIIFIGFKGCGKTTIGEQVSLRLKRKFIDTDNLIEQLHFEKEGTKLTFREIYTRKGEEYFKSLEKEAVNKIISEDEKVISLGGGTLFNVEDLAEKLSAGIVVYLYVAQDILFERILENGLPSFLDTGSPRASFDALFKKRAPLYKKISNIMIDNSKITVDEAVSEAVRKIENYGG